MNQESVKTVVEQHERVLVACSDGAIALLIRLDGSRTGVQVPNEPNIRWIKSAELIDMGNGALIQTAPRTDRLEVKARIDGGVHPVYGPIVKGQTYQIDPEHFGDELFERPEGFLSPHELKDKLRAAHEGRKVGQFDPPPPADSPPLDPPAADPPAPPAASTSKKAKSAQAEGGDQCLQ